MNKKSLMMVIAFAVCISCKIAFISGYDFIIDETATNLKRDFTVFFTKFSRTMHTSGDPNDQSFSNFQDYYDHMEADIKTLEERSVSLPKKSDITKKQIENIKKLMMEFENMHKKGVKDSVTTAFDNKRDYYNNINIAINSLINLQEQLKSTGK